MEIGDVHWVDFPSKDGREQAGVRPAVIMQEEAFGGSLPTVVVVPMSSVARVTRFACVSQVEPDGQNGLTRTSYALVFQVGAIDRRRIRSRLGMLGKESLEEINKLLDRLLGRESEVVSQGATIEPHTPGGS